MRGSNKNKKENEAKVIAIKVARNFRKNMSKDSKS